MNRINVLSEEIANKIAAGEVVERPSSIVKELIENALDAGATQVEVEIKNGGKSLIRIADNGFGMSAADAELAFRRHGTSKIKSAEDLNEIASFGFRGEALPSIAAVSRLSLKTREKDAASGTEILIEGGVTKHVRECPHGVGTVVEVKDLFFNTPARRKFLRADSTELGHVSDVVANFALSHPHVKVLYKSSDRVLYDLPPVKDPLERAGAVLGDNVAPHLIAIDETKNNLRVWGMIGKPFVARASRTGQNFFINRRWIKSIGLSYGLQAGYQGLLMHGQYPVGVIFIDLDLNQVDVNVHPNKQEVRLSNEAEIKSFLKRVVAKALQEADDHSPDLKPFKPSIPSSAEVSTAPSGNNPVKRDPISQFAAEIHAEQDAERTQTVAAESQTAIYASETNLDMPETINIRNQLKITKVLGQIHHTFIVAETDEGFMLVDQHAAHERVMYEQVKDQMESGKPISQSLLMDEILDLHPRQVELLNSKLPMLSQMGFQIEEFGDNSFVIRSYPAVLNIADTASFLKNYLDELEDGSLQGKVEAGFDDVAATIACKKKSVKAHDVLSISQMQGLLENLSRCENPFSCPHGRPTFFKRSFYELEKEFKRK